MEKMQGAFERLCVGSWQYHRQRTVADTRLFPEAVLAELDEFIKLAEEQTIKGMTAEVAEYSKKLRKQL